MKSVKDLLQKNLKRHFVGRKSELDLFKELITSTQASYLLLYIQGQGGQGKSSLLRYYANFCDEAGYPFIYIDGRHIEANQQSFMQAFRDASGQTDDPFAVLHRSEKKTAIIIDSYEKISTLDDWLRMHFLPRLPANVAIVMAGRNELGPCWKVDPSWQNLIKHIYLPELNLCESRDLLLNRNVPEPFTERIIEFTHGNALALSIVADTFDQNRNEKFLPIHSPDVVKLLLDQFVEEVPDEDHRTALELCSVVHTTTEKMLQLVCGEQKATELFNWLSGLTFIEKGPIGLNPHDVVREVIVSELSWRNPQKLQTLLYKARCIFAERVATRTGHEQRLLLFALLYLHRFDPAIADYFNFEESISFFQETATEKDLPEIVNIMRRYHSAETVDCFMKWAHHPAATLWIYRSSDSSVDGFVMKIEASQLTSETHDPVMNSVLEYAKKKKLEPEQLCTVFRFWMAAQHYQDISSVQSSIFASLIQYYATPGLALTFIATAQPSRYQECFHYGNIYLDRRLNYTEDHTEFGFYVHDWRKENVMEWMSAINQKGIAYLNRPHPVQTYDTQMVSGLTQDDFFNAVSDALKFLDNPNRLIQNPLVKCHFIQKNIPAEYPGINQALILIDKIREKIDRLKEMPKYDQFYRLLYRTFINPAGSQADVADFLCMSFSTYRRQLKNAIKWVAEMLWIEENQLALLQEP